MQSANDSKSTSMKFQFKNIGPVKEAEIELGDLTIIVGRNNTGKTYLTYTLYGLLKICREWAEDSLTPLLPMEIRDFERLSRKAIETVIETGKAEQPIDRDSLNQIRKKMIELLARNFSENVLSDVFSSPEAAFEDASLKIVLNDAYPLEIPPKKEGDFSISYNGSNIVIEQIHEQTKRISHPRTRAMIYSLFLSFLFPKFPDPFILSAERLGISLFYKELDFTKNQLVDLLQKMGDQENRNRYSPFLIIDGTTSRYALPIKDNITYTRGIGGFRTQRSEIYKDQLFNDIKDMMEGYYTSSGDDIEFSSKSRGKRKFIIPLHIASSSARGLSDLYFYLRHVAQKNHLLIIDEPESHLDTTNQILLARLLARCVHVGLKVLITTHSDYLIKEINNLIMLSKSFDNKEEVVKKLGYRENDFLEPDAIRAYVAEGNGVSRCEVNDFGIDMPVFDETIDKINRVSNELATRLAAEDGQK